MLVTNCSMFETFLCVFFFFGEIVFLLGTQIKRDYLVKSLSLISNVWFNFLLLADYICYWLLNAASLSLSCSMLVCGPSCWFLVSRYNRFKLSLPLLLAGS